MSEAKAEGPQSWEALAAKHKQSCFEKIPSEWRLPSKYLELASTENSTANVLSIPRECGLLTSAEVLLTENNDATSLLESLHSGQVTSLAVTTAFCKRAAIAQQLTECLTETFFPEAIERAKYLDGYFARTRKPIGPLHGLPISLKDSFKLKGIPSTIGFVSFIERPVTDNSCLVNLLLDLGAVLYVKTNIPQTLMVIDSHNHIFGRAKNPHKLSHRSGGSSGGEGALIAMRGSVLGVGTDIGGSIRIPAYCCGIYGFKPSSGRVPYGNQQGPGRKGMPGIVSAAGPLASTFRDLRLFMETIITAQPWTHDSTATAVPWTNVTFSKPKTMRIGILSEDSTYPVDPPVSRALASAAARLSSAGHTLVPLTGSPSLEKALELAVKYFGLDPAQTAMKNILASGEPMIPSVIATVKMFAHLNQKALTLDDLIELNVELMAYKAEWHAVFKEKKIDVVMAPASETTALEHDGYGNCPYTSIWNLLDYPAVVVPYLKADKSIDFNTRADKITTHIYDVESNHGLPCAVQIVAPNMRDELLVEAGEIISDCLATAE